MSRLSLFAEAYSTKESDDYQKHVKAVKFCIENGLSYPKETNEFFRNNVPEEDLNSYQPKTVLESIKDGVRLPMHYDGNHDMTQIRIRICDIPPTADEIIVTMD